MSHRRNFLKGSMATVAVATNASYNVAEAKPFVAVDRNVKPLPVILNSDEYHSLKTFLSSRATQLDKTLLKLQDRHLLGTNGWAANNIQMHTRYVPSIDGVALEASTVKKSKDLDLIENYGRNAMKVSTLPCGVIINRSKAKRHNIRTYSLSDFSAQKVKPHFPLNSSASAPENSWLITSLTEAGIIGNTPHYSSVRKRKAIEKFVEKYALNLELPCFHSDSVNQLYTDLITDNADIVALYGSPETLHSLLNEKGNTHHKFDEFSILSLQDFFEIKTPSFFPSRFLQAGVNLNHPLTDDIFGLIADHFLPISSLENQGERSADINTMQALKHVNEGLESRHNSAYFNTVMGLETLMDGGFLVSLMLDMVSGMRFHGDKSSTKLTEISEYTMAETEHRWGETVSV